MSDFKPLKLKKHAAPAGRRLYLVRCADAAGGKRYADADRPLSEKGLKSLKKLCKFIRKNAISPDLIVCSPVRRGRETLQGVLSVLNNAEIVFLDALYTGDGDEIRGFINDLPPEKRTVMVIGHTPSLKILTPAKARPKSKKPAKGKVVRADVPPPRTV